MQEKKQKNQRFYVLRSLGWLSLAKKNRTSGWWFILLYFISVQILPVRIPYVHIHSSYSQTLASAWSRGEQLPQQCGTVVIYRANIKGYPQQGTAGLFTPCLTLANRTVLQVWGNRWGCVTNTAAEEMPSRSQDELTTAKVVTAEHPTPQPALPPVWDPLTEPRQPKVRKVHRPQGRLQQQTPFSTILHELYRGRGRSDIANSTERCNSQTLTSCFMFHYPQYQRFPKTPATGQK